MLYYWLSGKGVTSTGSGAWAEQGQSQQEPAAELPPTAAADTQAEEPDRPATPTDRPTTPLEIRIQL